jgi:hypothetical protein
MEFECPKSKKRKHTLKFAPDPTVSVILSDISTQIGIKVIQNIEIYPNITSTNILLCIYNN